MSEGICRFAQQVVHARVKMDLNSDTASAKILEVQSMAKKMALLAKEAEEAHNAALAGGQTAAGIATQLLAAGAEDSEKPEAYEDKESEAEVGCASSEPNACAVLLKRGRARTSYAGEGARAVCTGLKQRLDFARALQGRLIFV